jgi:RND superfamily putative drug exporter
MLRLARLSVRRPRLSLLAWMLVAVTLSLVGLGVTGSLSPTDTTVAGSQSARAEHLARAQFGPSVLVPILLEGPRASLDRQGPALVRALGVRRDTRVLSAWDGGDVGKQLRAGPEAAMVLAAVARTEEAMVAGVQGQVDRTVERVVAAPVRATVTGTPSLDRAMRDQAIDATRTGLAIALPALLLVLLAVLRAPVAAAALTVLGAGTAFSALGLMTLVGRVIAVDAVAVASACMIGLALGAGYGLLLFRRWRDDGATAVESTGRAVLVGGTALVVALLLAPLIADTEILTSIGIGALLCAALGVGAAVVVMPAFLELAGDRATRWSFVAPAPARRAWERLVAAAPVGRRAVPAGALATAVLAALAIPLLTLETGPPSPSLLPASDGARESFEHVADVMGPGWPTPFNIVVVSRRKPITDAALLRRLDRLQAQIAKDPRVASVTGPGAFAATSKDLGVLPKQLEESSKLLEGGKKDLGRLQRGLGQAGDGVDRLRSGLRDAASGAGRLQGGSGTAQGGAGKLHAGLVRARDGAAQISGGLATALGAARKLRDGAGKALEGAGQLTSGLKQASGPVKAGAPIVKQLAADVASGRSAVASASDTATALGAQLAEAVSQVQGLPDSPSKQSALGAIASAQTAASGLTGTLQSSAARLSGAAGVATAFSEQVGRLSTGLAALYAGSTQLRSGIAQLHDGNGKLAAGMATLSGGGGELEKGITALRDGAGQLEAGLGQLTGGAGQLATGLTSGIGPSGRLASGLGTAEAKVRGFRGNLPSTEDLERLQRESPGLFTSGYFVLSAIAGATPEQRNQASFVVDLEGGGNAGQITVIARRGIASHDTQALGADLTRRADAFAAATRTEVAVGGPAGALADFRSETASRIWPIVLITAAVVALLLVALLRTIALPLVAVAFDLLTCAATFGVLALLFGGDDPLLGGPGFLDPMTIIGVFSVVFGLTMVYEVQLLHRVREALVAGEDPGAALRRGLSSTAAAGTGAALAMVAAFAGFAGSGLLTVRALGVAVAIAVLLDALVVRPVLLPAAVQVLGGGGWWPTRRHVPTRLPGAPA